MTRIEIATQVLAANPHVVEDAMQWVKDLVDTSLEFAESRTENAMTESEKQIKEIKEAIAKYHASLRNIGVHRPHAANTLIHNIQEILQINWSDRLSCS